MCSTSWTAVCDQPGRPERPSRGRIIAAALGLAIACTACGESLEFADWIIPVPDGTPIHEYAPVRVAERRVRIDLVEDLVIGERDGDDNYMLYNPRDEAEAQARPLTGAAL